MWIFVGHHFFGGGHLVTAFREALPALAGPISGLVSFAFFSLLKSYF